MFYRYVNDSSRCIHDAIFQLPNDDVNAILLCWQANTLYTLGWIDNQNILFQLLNGKNVV